MNMNIIEAERLNINRLRESRSVRELVLECMWKNAGFLFGSANCSEI